MGLTQEQKTFIIESYFRNGHQVNGQWVYEVRPCLREFRGKFPDVAVLEANFVSTVNYVVKLFRETGSIQRKAGSGRPTTRTPEVVENVRQVMDDNPHTSLRRLSQQVDLSYSTCQKILKKDLMLYPYKMQVFQELQPPDYEKRIAYCNWFNQTMNDDLLNLTFFSDEAYFHLSGYVNSQNMRMWSAENPHIFQETPLHPQKIGVWVAISRRRLIGPIFFEESVTAVRYQNMLEEFINELHPDELQNGYFQHDGATAHTAHTTLNYLRQYYDDRLISSHTAHLSTQIARFDATGLFFVPDFKKHHL